MRHFLFNYGRMDQDISKNDGVGVVFRLCCRARVPVLLADGQQPGEKLARPYCQKGRIHHKRGENKPHT